MTLLAQKTLPAQMTLQAMSTMRFLTAWQQAPAAETAPQVAQTAAAAAHFPRNFMAAQMVEATAAPSGTANFSEPKNVPGG